MGVSLQGSTYDLKLLQGQRIVARLRERLFAASIRQEVEFVEKGEGDALSRLSVDTSIVGERSADEPISGFLILLSTSVTNNLSDGLRAIVMSSVGCKG